MIRRLHYLIGSLKLRLALAGLVLIAASVALTVVLVLQAMEQRGQRAVLDSEVANTERIGVVLSARIVSLQKALRAASAQVPVPSLGRPAARPMRSATHWPHASRADHPGPRPRRPS